jgi:hypothetical protein
MEKLKLVHHKFKRRVQRFALNMLKSVSINQNDPKKEHEAEAISICKRLVNMSDSVLSMSPRTQKRFIINDSQNTSIIIKNGSIYIYSNKYPYPTPISDRGYNFIVNIIDNEIERRREYTEHKIEVSVKQSLKTIINNLSDAKII